MNLLERLLCVIGSVTVFGTIILAALVWLPEYLAGMIAALVVVGAWFLSGRLEKEFRQ